MSQKKCPHCGKWSEWTTSFDDRCEHCGEPLSPVDLERKAKKEEEAVRQEQNWMFYIKPDDGALMRFLKKSGNLFYMVFMAIMSFIMWVIAALPG